MSLRFVAALVTLGLLALTGCSGVEGTEGKQWITGDAQIIRIAPEDREDPVEASGTSLEGEPLDLADYRDRVVVANTWASWCPPCRAEMPLVVELDEEYDDAEVAVLGVNIRDNEANAKAFVRTSGMGFPSFHDFGSQVLLGFSGRLTPYSLPSTMILDRQGRLAVLVLGAIPGRTTIRDLIDEVAAES